MGTGRGNLTNGIEGVNQVPTSSKKMIQNLKEIVNCSEAEIYATLKECNMDPNEAVSRLLSQGIFSFFFLLFFVIYYNLFMVEQLGF